MSSFRHSVFGESFVAAGATAVLVFEAVAVVVAIGTRVSAVALVAAAVFESVLKTFG